MKFLEGIKTNLPVILLLVLTPYFFFSEATISQGIIVTSLSALVGFKYFLEQKEEVKEFKKIIETMALNTDENFKKMEKELLAVKQKMGLEGYNKQLQKNNISDIKDVSSIW